MQTKKSQDNKIKIGGTRLRPRVALLGIFSKAELKKYKKLFPTIWHGLSSTEIDDMVSYLEIDLIIINPDVVKTPIWLDQVHVICFSKKVESLPGPTNNSATRLFYRNEDTAEYALPEMELPYSRRRDADFARLNNVKGWKTLHISQKPSEILIHEEARRAQGVLFEGAIIFDPFMKAPFATIFNREENNLGIAWLPQPIFNRVAWVGLITTEWAKSDQIRFSGFVDWTQLPEWMVPKEEELAKKITELEEKKRDTIRQIGEEIGALQLDLTEATLAADKEVRRLLTAQGAELVDEVANAFRKIGFKVRLMDKELEPTKSKREDLRLQDTSEQEGD